eukprot:gnl/Dysnectes_brevis/892_a987_3390.p1 GENE.gnl/Dysnectes_brevis/892_a987_3390~~gnl/Dysnectes_brevis/892_a987_3390.p1  ORF type:complete len:603 (-),score=214.71 gnl/Dysnectes_brevis/892_a987_3390:95-1903(-)
MSEQAPAVPKLHLDAETGDMVTKSELKRRKKMRQKAKKAAEKAALKAAQPQTQKKKKVTEVEITDPRLYTEARTAEIRAMEAAGRDPWPHKYHITVRLADLRVKHEDALRSMLPEGQKGNVFADEEEAIAGRIMFIRPAGKNLIFFSLRGDAGAEMQVMASRSEASGYKWDDLTKLKRGDIVGFKGKPGLSRRGEFSLFPVSFQLLAPCFKMLPKGKNSLSTIESRFRQRYLDLLLSKNSQRILITRSKVIRAVRKFFDTRGFLEVETPTLNTLAGGASASPFVTHHNELKMSMFLRIAPELYLKRLVVGGLDRVFEIGKSFRNEGIDLTHNPEFTMLEAYGTYLDYEDLMEMVTEMIQSIVMEVHGKLQIDYHVPLEKDELKAIMEKKRNGEEVPIESDPDHSPVPTRRIVLDFSDFKRVRMIEEMEKHIGAIPRPLNSPEAMGFLQAAVKTHCPDMPPPFTAPRMLDRLVEAFIEPMTHDPMYIMDHPQVMSPLAKPHRKHAEMTERFELMIGPFEVANAYTELNNPFVQAANFQAQAKDKEGGDTEAMDYDLDFCQALEYGLPPTGGLGIGIDRLVMLLTDCYNIKEVIAFPTMKPHQE